MAHTPPGRTRKKIYDFMRDRLLHGHAPTTREVQHAFGFKAVQSARQHLEALVAEGKLIKDAGKARGYQLPPLTGNASPTQFIPMLGHVQAGALTTAIEYPDGYIPVEADQADGLFALTVKGESMLNAGILPEDTVIVHRQTTAKPGDVVVALVGEEATVKTYRENKGRVELHPENEAFAPIIPLSSGEPFSLLGKVIEVRRKLR